MKKIIISIVGICIVLLSIVCFKNYNQVYTYEWVEVKESSVGQYILYINDSKGRHVDGTARLVYIDGGTQKLEIPKEGLLYVKSVVKEVRNPKRK